MNVYKSLLSAGTSADDDRTGEEIENVSGNGLFKKKTETKGSNPATGSVRRPVQQAGVRQTTPRGMSRGAFLKGVGATALALAGVAAVPGRGMGATAPAGAVGTTIVGVNSPGETHIHPILGTYCTEDVYNVQFAALWGDSINLQGTFNFGNNYVIVFKEVTVRGEEPTLIRGDPTKPGWDDSQTGPVTGGTWPTTITGNFVNFVVRCLGNFANDNVIIENLDLFINFGTTPNILQVGKHWPIDTNVFNPELWVPEAWQEGGNLTVRKCKLEQSAGFDGDCIASYLIGKNDFIVEDCWMISNRKSSITNFMGKWSLISVTNSTLDGGNSANTSQYGMSFLNHYDDDNYNSDGQVIFKDNIVVNSSSIPLLWQNLGAPIDIEHNYFGNVKGVGISISSFNENAGIIKDNYIDCAGAISWFFSGFKSPLISTPPAVAVNGLLVTNNTVVGNSTYGLLMANLPAPDYAPNYSSNNVITGNNCSGLTTTVSQVFLVAEAHDNIFTNNIFGTVSPYALAAVFCEGDNNSFIKNDYRQTGIPGITNSDLPCVYLSWQSNENLVHESGRFPQGTNAKDQVLDEGTQYNQDTGNVNNVVGHKAKTYAQQEGMNPGIGQRKKDAAEATEELTEMYEEPVDFSGIRVPTQERL